MGGGAFIKEKIMGVKVMAISSASPTPTPSTVPNCFDPGDGTRARDINQKKVVIEVKRQAVPTSEQDFKIACFFHSPLEISMWYELHR